MIDVNGIEVGDTLYVASDKDVGWIVTKLPPRDGYLWDHFETETEGGTEGLVGPKDIIKVVKKDSQTNCSQMSTSGDDLYGPKWGDIVHVNGEGYVVTKVNNTTVNACDRFGNDRMLDITLLDEYKPDPTQELRQKILKKWQGQSLDNSYDTEVCRADASVGDVIDFVMDCLGEFGEKHE